MSSSSLLLSRRDALAGLTGGIGLALLPRRAAAAPYSAIALASPGRIGGLVRYTGRVAPAAKLRLTGAVDYCRAFDLRSEELLVSGAGGLRNVVVFLEGIGRGKPIPAESPVMAERRCTFVPHVLSMTAGSKLVLHNDDPVLNTFHAIEVASARTLFNIGMPQKDQRVSRRIRSPGVVKMLCDVHPWELGYVVAFSHPYHAVTDGAGAFTLEGVPAGRYTLCCWHEKLGTRRRPVEVRPGAQLKVELLYR
jgi:hypothetical protein